MSQSSTQSGRVMSPPPGPGRRCPAPAVQNGAAKLRKRGRRIKYKCYRGFTIVGPKQVGGTQFRHCQCEYKDPNINVKCIDRDNFFPQIESARHRHLL